MKNKKLRLSDLVKVFFMFLSYITRKKYVMFIPHKHMCINDHYSIANYRSDSALSFAHFVLENNLLPNKTIVIGISTNSNMSLIQKYVKDHFPQRPVKFVTVYLEKSDNEIYRGKKRLEFWFTFARSSHVFTSQTPLFRPLASSKKITVTDLGYYTAPIKDSTHDKNSPVYIDYSSMNEKDFNYYIVTSEVSKRLIMGTYGFNYNQFKIMGMCRNDYLFSDVKETTLRRSIEKETAYPVRKIVLYTPTHRDYDEKKYGVADASQELLGFKADLNALDKFLQENGILIYCKMHPKQNTDVIKKQNLPSIKLFEGNDYYGLNELMKVSDALITDYTSGYFDYLILDKPVIFNLFDINKYTKTRGLIFNPITPICAGEVIHDEKEFVDALTNLDENEIKYREKRKDLLDMFNYYKDSNTCQRVYEFFFGKTDLS